MTAVKRAAATHAGQKQELITVSQSVFKGWRRCKQLYQYRYVQLLERRRPILQLQKGSMVGRCIDAIVAKRTKMKGVPTDWRKVLEDFKKQFGSLWTEELEYYGDIHGEVSMIVERYERIYADDGFEYQLDSDGKPYEIELQLDFIPGVIFTGHIDKIPIDKSGRAWDLDHKTAKNFPDPDYRFADQQQVFYQWATPLTGQGLPKLSGVIWDYIRTKPPAVPEILKKGGLTRRQNIDTDYETYMAAIQRHKLNPADYKEILNDLKPRGHMDFFQRIRLPTPSKELIKTVVDDAKITAAEIRDQGSNPHQVRSMDNFSCPRCEFFSLCQAEARGEDSSFIRKKDYQIQKEPRHAHHQEAE